MAAGGHERTGRGFWRLPLDDLAHGLDRALEIARAPAVTLIRIALGLALGWWLYVPVHELLHAFGCLAAGGEVSRLEIARIYGGDLVAAVVPFAVAGSDYAGRLAGFDTGGSDAVYLATVLAPYALTVFPGVFWLRRWGAAGRAFGFGFAVPWALAPFVSLLGDAYELGAIAVTRLPPWHGADARALLRGDDLVLLAGGWVGEGAGVAIWLGGALAAVLGIVWAFATYALGARLAPVRGEGGSR